jgi:2-amino-4-hydroxy-6-hydroxymethyldihydropteridine diphosphokinase
VTPAPRERAFVSLGSNVAPEASLRRAVRLLAQRWPLLAVSSVYANPAVGPPGQPDFLNAAVLLAVPPEPRAIRAALRELETRLGRRRGADRYAPRTADLDLCLLGAMVLRDPDWTLPDPEILTRAHKAVPLAELDPAFRHPLTGQTLEEIARAVPDRARLRRRDDLRLDAAAGA